MKVYIVLIAYYAKEYDVLVVSNRIQFVYISSIKVSYNIVMYDLIFIITRCVQKPEHNRLYQECYRCIRALYDNPIYIIDDNSNKDHLITIDMSGVEIIQSEFPGAGEILPYYYLYHRKLAKKAIILQDSMFIQQKIDFNTIDDYKFLWYFTSYNTIKEVKGKLYHVVSSLPVYEELCDLIFDYKWSGCFGTCMVITLDFLSEMQEKIGILDIIKDISIRSDRCMLERLLAICAYYMNPKEPSEISILGNIHNQAFRWAFTYEEYLVHCSELRNLSHIVKAWNGR